MANAHCAIDVWHPLFAGRGCTPKATILPLPDDFFSYLQQDGVVLPPSFGGGARTPTSEEWAGTPGAPTVRELGSDSDSDGSGDGNAEAPPPPELPGLARAIGAALAEATDGVCPRLAFSAPTDAAWMQAGNELRCTTASDVLLLLKGSDKAAAEAASAAPRPVLALRHWTRLEPGMEFRCFAKDGVLVGLSQRRCDVRNAFLEAPELQRRITLSVARLHERHVLPQFPSRTCVFDAYCEKRRNEASLRAWLLDFEPWGGETDAGLFDWAELEALAEADGGAERGQEGEADPEAEPETEAEAAPEPEMEAEAEPEPEPELRVVTTDMPMVPSKMMRDGVPIDLLDGSEGSALDIAMKKLRAEAGEDLV